MHKSEFIDYAKAFSIITIVIFHFLFELHLPPMVNYAAHFGGAGVHLFFFASGYGLTLSKYSGYFSFLKRRLNKILIPYYISIVLIFIVNLFVNIYPSGFPALLSHIFLYKMFVPKYEGSFGIQFWFISTIVQFYLVFPLLLKLINYKKYRIIIFLSLGISLIYSLSISLSPYAAERVFNGFFLQYLWEFVLGMVIAKTNLLDKIINKPVIYFFILAFICIPVTGLLAVKGGAIGKNFNDITSFFGYASVVIIFYKLFKPFRKGILWVSGFSYSLYLIHMLIFDLFKREIDIDKHILLVIPVIFIVAIAVSFIFNFLLEKLTKKLSFTQTHPSKVQTVI